MVTDPVTGYKYPEEWEKACKNPESLELVRRGLGVLTSKGEVLKRGFTTGTTAAAACRAAVLSLKDPVDSVMITLPCSLSFSVEAQGRNGTGKSLKYSGDYKNDITSGILFCAKASPSDCGIKINAGEGIGRLDRDTPRYKKGSPAISKTAMDCIVSSVREAVADTGLKGVTVTLTIPKGKETAQKTLNPKIGILGGISVLGSTGLVEPWDDHLTESVAERIKGHDLIVITTGRVGLRVSRLLFPDYETVLVGKYIQKGIDAASESKEIIICGLPALIIKFIDPNILKGTDYRTVEELSMSPEWDMLSQKVLHRYKKEKPYIRVVIVNREGHIIGDSG
ncbi:cobalt-precorrin-5B (C1)-methyltransferase [Methanomicrobium sp. W14]|uniref:cobalt-precorrin-5B (C(1))-methyltransferase n=1 Tax=Methanomicrobium sp. W14 TaxID=2817839 RepID=UPI001AE274D8|nr:cobalt-precorrin-5B (C(1))-methyltransferase [Methanomicrobium sp. W14]MBP2132756.1 cobalt-precorrin-5B (C1)-methyltransferase [Methanomicrobium sp. W14]